MILIGLELEKPAAVTYICVVQVWLQMVAAKLEKVKLEKREKVNKLGNIIDKVVSTFLQP